MKKKILLPYLLVFTALLILLSIPKPSAEKIRGAITASISPIWDRLTSFKSYFSASSKENTKLDDDEDSLKLKIENQLLKNEMKRLQDLLQQEFYLHQDLDNSGLQKLGAAKQKHQSDLNRILKLRLQSVPARVIFRSPASWHSSLWINIGESANQTLGRTVVGKNSPVVVGMSLIGIIDYVGQNQSRVRLITDSGLYPAVRAARGQPRDRWLADQLNVILDNLMERDDLFDGSEDREEIIQNLERVQRNLGETQESWYLAKGEVHGSSFPLWRTQGNILKGIGFNYDFSDSEGPARDLRSGAPFDPDSKEPPVPLLKVHDVLVTSGMDGVFPPGLNVAEVTRINPLKEGDYYYELEAVPTAGNLDELSLVFVLPPQEYDPAEKPPILGHIK